MNEQMKESARGLSQRDRATLYVTKAETLAAYLRFCAEHKEVPREEIIFSIESLRTPKHVEAVLALITKDRS